MNWELEAVDTLEFNEDYEKARKLLHAKWTENPMDEKLLIRLGFISWYVLAEWGLIPIKDLEKKDFEKTLAEVTDFGMEHFRDSINFLWIFGYMMSLFPHLFGDYEKMEQQGRAMLKAAHKMDKSDPIIKMVYLGHEHKSRPEAYEEACLRSKELLAERFKGCGVMVTYFREVLDR